MKKYLVHWKKKKAMKSPRQWNGHTNFLAKSETAALLVTFLKKLYVQKCKSLCSEPSNEVNFIQDNSELALTIKCSIYIYEENK